MRRKVVIVHTGREDDPFATKVYDALARVTQLTGCSVLRREKMAEVEMVGSLQECLERVQSWSLGIQNTTLVITEGDLTPERLDELQQDHPILRVLQFVTFSVPRRPIILKKEGLTPESLVAHALR